MRYISKIMCRGRKEPSHRIADEAEKAAILDALGRLSDNPIGVDIRQVHIYPSRVTQPSPWEKKMRGNALPPFPGYPTFDIEYVLSERVLKVGGSLEDLYFLAKENRNAV